MNVEPSSEGIGACDTLFYDGRCPLCRGEMEKLARYKPDSLALVDIHSVEIDEDIRDRESLLKQLHYRNANGEWVSGIEANILAWQGTRFEFLWRLLRLPLVYPFASYIYNRWASWRYRRLYQPS